MESTVTHVQGAEMREPLKDLLGSWESSRIDGLERGEGERDLLFLPLFIKHGSDEHTETVVRY